VRDLDSLLLDLVNIYIPSELPENAPRYVVLSYELSHPDGRRSYPLVLVNWAPITSSVDLLTLHASAFLDFQAQVSSDHQLLSRVRH
jgi:hypothetical protein